MPLAIEVFPEASDRASVRIDINGSAWARVATQDLPEKLAEIGRAYGDGQLLRLITEGPNAAPPRP